MNIIEVLRGMPHVSSTSIAAEQKCHQYLNKESIPFILTLNGLDCYVLSFPYGLEDNSKGPSANSLKKNNMTVGRYGAKIKSYVNSCC